MPFICTSVLLTFIKLDCESSNIKLFTIRMLSKVMNIKSRFFGSLILDIVIFEIYNVDDVTLIAVSTTSISDIIKLVKFIADIYELNNEFCCVMLDEFWTLNDAEINVNIA